MLDSVQQHDDLKGGIQIIVIIFMINESLLENACNIVVQTNSRFHTLQFFRSSEWDLKGNFGIFQL